MTILFSVLGLGYFLFIFLIRNRITVRSNRLNAKKKELAPIISNFLFHDEDNSVPEKKDYVKLKIEIRDALKDASFRKVLTEILLDLQKDVFGDTRKKLNELYIQLDLHHDAYKKLKDWRWHIVSQGILELTQMQVVDSFNFITKFINDRRGIIRKQAEVATVTLKPEGISYFLDTTNFSISEWQQLKLMEVLRNMDHFRPPAFKTWLVSGNRDVVLFALRLIRYYNQSGAEQSIIALVKHKNERIKMEAIKCIKEFCLISALDTLKAVFSKAGQAVKIEILDTVATLGNEEELEFLKYVEQQSSSFLVKNKAQMAINEIMPGTFIPSKNIMSEKELNAPELTETPFDEEYIAEQVNLIAENPDTDSINSNEQPAHNFESTLEPEPVPDVEPERSEQDIEVYEVDPETISVQNSFEIDEESAPSSDTVETSFEIGLLDESLDSSISDQIGLISTTEEEIDFEVSLDFPDVEHYFKMQINEKASFIDLLEESATDKEILLLEELMQREDDSEIRYRLFKILQSIKNENRKPDTIENDPETSSLESIFHSLFEYASDLDSKLILLKEICEVGDEKELPLLRILENDENPVIKAQAKKSRAMLNEKLAKIQGDNGSVGEPINEETKEGTTEVAKQVTSSESRDRLPLELCFLEEYGIEFEKEQETEIGFELAEEYYQEQERRIALDE